MRHRGYPVETPLLGRPIGDKTGASEFAVGSKAVPSAQAWLLRSGGNIRVGCHLSPEINLSFIRL